MRRSDARKPYVKMVWSMMSTCAHSYRTTTHPVDHIVFSNKHPEGIAGQTQYVHMRQTYRNCGTGRWVSASAIPGVGAGGGTVSIRA